MTIHHAPPTFGQDASAPARSAKGAASELVACAELMRAGYYVYRCESPNAPFDVVAYRDGQCHRVEVKSVTFTEVSHWRIAPSFSRPKNDEWDLLVVVGNDAEVFIFAAGTAYEAAKEIIREHYGFAPRVADRRGGLIQWSPA